MENEKKSESDASFFTATGGPNSTRKGGPERNTGERKKKNCTFCKKNGHVFEECYARQKCTYCQKTGHIADDCFHLHGREKVLARRKKGVATLACGEGPSEGSKSVKGFTREEIQQIASIIRASDQESKGGDSGYCHFSEKLNFYLVWKLIRHYTGAQIARLIAYTTWVYSFISLVHLLHYRLTFLFVLFLSVFSHS